jgi:Nif-specific regulatory protein
LSTRWTTWNEHAWLQHGEGGVATVQLADRLLGHVADTPSGASFLSQMLPDVASDFAVQWTAIVDRWPQWTTRAEFGRQPFEHLPARFFEEALDREAGGLTTETEQAGWSLLVAPLLTDSQQQTVLALAGRRIENDDLARCVALSRTLATSLLLAERLGRLTHKEEQLRETLRVAYRLSDIFETVPLLEALAEEATRLLRCDRASIFIWDRQEQKLLACPALGVEGGTLYLPDNVGIVGSVIQSGEAICVDDAYEDERFNRAVDRETGYRTKSLLCVPLLDGDGRLIGAFQGINKVDGLFDSDDEDILGQLGIQAAIALRNTRERERLIRTHRQLTEQMASRVRIVGDSTATDAVREKIERLAPTDLPVLILGASGTGKEVVAQSLHYHGPRCDEPFVAVNCAALTETLLESELFGHEKGAFTDASATHKGKFELADGGTVFLDEIGDMSPGGQAKLLRVLEQKVITRVGGSQTIPVNVRIVSATNVNLAEAVREKKFREDLYYRLNVVTLELPPLCERPDDILPLAEFFLRHFCPQARRPVLEINDDAARRLKAHAWPGNVRELRNLMERVAFLSSGDRVEEADLAFVLSPLKEEQQIEAGVDLGLSQATTRFQMQYIERAIARSGGNMSEAARILGLHRSNLYRKMKQLGMHVPDES